MACSRSWLARTSGYRQVTSHVHKHRTAHAKRGMNLLSACSHVRKLAVFEVRRTRAKSSISLKVMSNGDALVNFIVICIPLNLLYVDKP